METFDDNFSNVAYVLGALFAIYEEIQRLANPNINTTIHDRYFSLAQTSPKAVFHQLNRLAEVQLRQALRRNPASANYLQNCIKRQLMKISPNESPIPAHFSSDEKDLFILGYYHKKNWNKA